MLNIYKLDEDIFVTKDYFEIMYKTYIDAEEKGRYQVGFVAPLIPINGYGNMRLLEKLGLETKYEEMFERPLYAAGANRMIENNPDVAKFFWGEKNIIPSIDELAEKFGMQPMDYRACPIRFSIGAILFNRTMFEDMGMFSVNRKTTAMGADEIELCSNAMKNSKAIIVSENTVVGHLSFGGQNAAMKEYYLANRDKFRVK